MIIVRTNTEQKINKYNETILNAMKGAFSEILKLTEHYVIF